ncbi:MAG: DedA family protein [Hyphomicrobiales bacterium]|nr:DedA family protein [Hyphomicrobiales bacterium]
MLALISTHAVWLVAAFIALETIGAPLPAEAALIAAGMLAAHDADSSLGLLIAAGIVAATAGNAVGFWIGQRYGHHLLLQYGARFGLNADRIRIGQWLFDHYGGRFVFVARFLPFLRNMAAVLAGTNAMPAATYYLASTAAAIVWVTGYALASYSIGEIMLRYASPVAFAMGLAAVTIIIGVPALILRYEKRLLLRINQETGQRGPAEGD